MAQFQIKLLINAEEGVTADQIRSVLETGDCGELDALIVEGVGILKLKIKEVSEDEE